MIFHDVAMGKVVEMTEWLAFYDQLNFKVSSNFEYEVGGYMAYALACFHRFFAGSVRQKIEYPRKDYEVTNEHGRCMRAGIFDCGPYKVEMFFATNRCFCCPPSSGSHYPTVLCCAQGE